MASHSPLTRFLVGTIILPITEDRLGQAARIMVSLGNHRPSPTHHMAEILERIRPWLLASDHGMPWIEMRTGEDRHLEAPTTMTHADDLRLSSPARAAPVVAATRTPLPDTARILRLRLLLALNLDHLVDKTAPAVRQPPFVSQACLPHKASKHPHPR